MQVCPCNHLHITKRHTAACIKKKVAPSTYNKQAQNSVHMERLTKKQTPRRTQLHTPQMCISWRFFFLHGACTPASSGSFFSAGAIHTHTHTHTHTPAPAAADETSHAENMYHAEIYSYLIHIALKLVKKKAKHT